MWPLATLAALPFAEIALFVVVGARIGAGWTVALVLLAMIAGAMVIRREGLARARDLGRAAAAGGDPAAMMTDSALRLLAGFLLIAPGFLTDALALALLAGPSRRALVRWVAGRLGARAIVIGGFGARGIRFGDRPAPRGRPGDIPIDADYLDVTDAAPPRRRPPGADA
jgi:UPF0716 protein FxsA